MGQKKYPPLTPSEVTAILSTLGFVFKNKEGSHSQYERCADGKRLRAVVSVDTAEREFDDFLIKSMIGQSKFTRDQFYGATKRTAKRAGVPVFQPTA